MKKDDTYYMNSFVSLTVGKMKGFALVLLCALVAVQARHTAVQKSVRDVAALGENPWLLHLRIAISTSGLLISGQGTLISERWALTAATNVQFARFIWVRYGVVNVINPSLVTENSIVRLNPGFNSETGVNNVALININRVVHTTPNIAPLTLAEEDDEVALTGTFCSFGKSDDGPGETLSCSELTLQEEDGSLVASEDLSAPYDIGAGLVVDGVQVAIFTKASDDDSADTFTPIGAYVSWINTEAGLARNAEEVIPEYAPVNFVN